MVLYLPQIISKDKNVSDGMHTIMRTEDVSEKLMKEKSARKLSTVENKANFKRKVKL